MKTINEPKKNIALLWRRPKAKPIIYRPMRFLLQTLVEDGLLLYNVVTSEMVLLEEDERKAFESAPSLYSSEMDELIARHYLVPEDFDESKSVRELRALIKKVQPSKRVDGFTILPTTDCNARCYYCFESDFKRCTMTEKIASDVVDYIVKKCEAKPIQLCWFGGEPLVGHNRISQICEELRQKDISFSSSMVSNAYLFDENLIQTAQDNWKLKSIQITLDGTEEVYNETKAYINPRDNPYKRVLRNITLLLEKGIVVNIRLNVTDQNSVDLNALVDELSERFRGRKGLSCYSHAVYDGVGFEPLHYNEDSNELLDKQVVDLDKKLEENGLLGSVSRLPFLQVIHCMSDNDSCRLIYPDGTVGKCENKSSSEGIGDIYHDITDEEMDNWYKSYETFPTCEKCCSYPYCINLKVCPETGKCSKPKLDWKLSRYASIMEEQYRQYSENAMKPIIDDTSQVECES